MALTHLPSHRRIIIENMAHHAGTARHCQKFSLKADQTSGGDAIFKTHASFAIRQHVLELATATAKFFHHAALMILFDVDGQHLVRLTALTVDLAENHTRTADSQLVTFTTHVLEKDGQMQLTTTRHFEDV